MSTDQDQARLIAERVARRLAESRVSPVSEARPSGRASQQSSAPVSEELTALRAGLHDLESKLDRIESTIGDQAYQSSAPSRARLIDFVASAPPVAVAASINQPPARPQPVVQAQTQPAPFVPATHSPWLRDFNQQASHPSQERFGIEEATVAELVEFFESEKKCSVEPGEKPCDHCSMCSSRGF